MKTNLFTISSGSSASGILGCPSQWTNGDQRYVQVGPSPNLVHGAQGAINHEVLIFNACHDHWHLGLGPKRMMTAYGPRFDWIRQTKETQALMFNNHAKALELKHWHPVLCWTQSRHVDTTKSIMMLRASNGARGTGQIYFDEDRVSAYTVENILEESKDPDQFLALLRKHTDRFVFSSIADREPNESYRALKGPVVATEYIRDITREFRVHTDWQGKPWYYIERPRVKIGDIGNTPIYTASVEDLGVSAMLPPSAFAAALGSDSVYAEFTAMFSRIQVPLQSFDVFVTSDYTWGILETSPEFCYRDVPIGQLNSHARQLVEHQFHLIEQGVYA